MKVRELQQELLNMDPDLEVVILEAIEEEAYEPIHSWDYQYDDDGKAIGVILWPRY